MKQVGVVVRDGDKRDRSDHFYAPRRASHHPRLTLSNPLLAFSGASGGGGGGNDSLIKETMTDLLERLPDNFEMITMQLRAKPLLEGEAGPFVVVALQVINCKPDVHRITALGDNVEMITMQLLIMLNLFSRGEAGTFVVVVLQVIVNSMYTPNHSLGAF